MACFAVINVSQGSVATYARFGGSFNNYLTTNLPRHFPVKEIFKRFRFDRIMVMSLWPHFFGPPCRRILMTSYVSNARRYAIAVYAVVLCLSVCLSQVSQLLNVG